MAGQLKEHENLFYLLLKICCFIIYIYIKKTIDGPYTKGINLKKNQ